MKWSRGRGFNGAEDGLKEFSKVPCNLDRAEELRPYRALDPDRLKISGSDSRDPSPHLSDALWLAFQEPSSLLWSSELPTKDYPNLEKEDYDVALKMAKVWDSRGLLSLRQVPDDYHWSQGAMRFFNNYKNESCDRMIGDRRVRNWQEGRLPGVSRFLPAASMLAVLEIDPSSQRLSLRASDRKDFYHQLSVSPQRAATNGLWPLLKLEGLEGSYALAQWQWKKKRYDRRKDGDNLAHGGRAHAHCAGGVALQACFASVPQAR